MRSPTAVWAAMMLAVTLTPVLGEDAFEDRLQLAVAEPGQDASIGAGKSYLLAYQAEHGPEKYLEWLWKDPINLCTRPAFWGGNEWRTVAIDAGITGALFPLDNAARDLAQDNRSKAAADVLGPIDQWYGNYPLALYGAGMFASGLILKNEKLADSGFLATESVLYAGALANAIKAITQRDRPRSASDQYQFHGPTGRNPFGSSFVSGDTAIAFAFASSVSEVGQNPWVTWPLYALAGAVGAQRIHANAHWLSDVVGAAFLGHAVGKTIVRFHYQRDIEGKLTPYLTPDTVGLQVTFRF